MMRRTGSAEARKSGLKTGMAGNHPEPGNSEINYRIVSTSPVGFASKKSITFDQIGLTYPHDRPNQIKSFLITAD